MRQSPSHNKERVILAYGDSQAEVLDYVFFNNSEYVLHEDDSRVGWRSGWSTRGLSKAEHVERHLAPLSELPPETRHAFVCLAYGSVDIEWNLSYKRDVQKQNVDTDQFVEEMVCELEKSVERIVQRGRELQARPAGGPEVHIVLCVPFSPLPLSDGYLEAFEARNGGDPSDAYKVIDHAERMALWSQFCDTAQSRILASHPSIQVVDVREDFATQGFDAFMLDDHEDHHPDLAKSQHAVARRFENVSFTAADGTVLKLEPKVWPHKNMYPHVRRRFTKAATAKSAAVLPPPVALPPPVEVGPPVEVESPSTKPMERRPSSDTVMELPDPAVEMLQSRPLHAASPAKQPPKSPACKSLASPWRRPLGAIGPNTPPPIAISNEW